MVREIPVTGVTMDINSVPMVYIIDAYQQEQRRRTQSELESAVR